MAKARAQWSVVLRRPREEAQTIGLETLARQAGLHPDLVLRLVRLGLVEPVGGTPQKPLFAKAAASQLARAVRLRRDFGIDYAGAVLACELLGRIEQLERRLRRYETPAGSSNSGSRPSYSGGGGTSGGRPRRRK
jgi:hypothetical protein